MAIKYTIPGLLIYITMILYLAAFVTSLFRLRRTGDLLFLLAFIAAAITYVHRWMTTGHVPMKNLFEVFLTLGVLVYPISFFSHRLLRVGGSTFDMLIGAIVLFPAGFNFMPDPGFLPPALQTWLFAHHVGVYMLSYIIMAKAAFHAFSQIADITPRPDTNLLAAEQATYRMICLGFPLLTTGLLLGSIWAQISWGRYWGWDPKEMWSLTTWLIYLGYFHFRAMFGRKHPNLNSVWAIWGMLAILITLLWANLSRLFAGLHSYAS